MGHNTRRRLAPLRVSGFEVAAEEGDDTSIIFSSAHSEVEAHFEWKEGILWFKGKTLIFGRIKSVGSDEWNSAVKKLKQKCRIATDSIPRGSYRADVHG